MSPRTLIQAFVKLDRLVLSAGREAAMTQNLNYADKTAMNAPNLNRWMGGRARFDVCDLDIVDKPD